VIAAALRGHDAVMILDAAVANIPHFG